MGSEGDLGDLIQAVEQYPHLYDVKNWNYKNNQMKENTWKEIATALHISVDDCKRLWKNTRDRFTKEKRSLPTGSEVFEQSQWKYFHKMSFYNKVTTPRKKVIRIDCPQSSCSEDSGRPWSSIDTFSSPELEKLKGEPDMHYADHESQAEDTGEIGDFQTPELSQKYMNLGVLIELVKQYPYLYDVKNRNYKNNQMKENTWKEIGAILQIPVDDCKRIWKNTRDRFTKEKRRLRTDSEAPEQSQWRYFNKMFFYNRVTRPRKKRIRIERPQSSCSEDSSRAWSSIEATLSLEADEVSEPDIQCAENSTQTEYVADVNPLLPDTSREVKQETVNIHSPLEEIKNETEDVNDNGNVKENISNKVAVPLSNSNELFGQYVALRLNEITQKEQKDLRRKIMLILES